MTRLDGWPTRLRLLVDDARPRPFAWGVHDCCLFALADYKTMTGQDAPNVEPWSSLLQAQRLLARHSVEEWAALWFGYSIPSWTAARRGDVGLIESIPGGSEGETSMALAVVLGANACCPGKSGLEFMPLRSVIRTWRIG